MRVCYFIQNHLGPGQVSRLIEAIRSGSREPLFLVAHDPHAGHCTTDALRSALSDVDIFEVREPVRRGYFSMIEPWFDAVNRLRERQIDYDWIVYLSAQDYPTQPIERFESLLAAGDVDGYLLYWDAFSPETMWGRRKQGRYRYLFQYRDANLKPSALRLLRRLNGLQPFIHTHLTYGPRVGLRTGRSPFDRSHRCFSGKQWSTLSSQCAGFVLEEARRKAALVSWFARTVCPDEAVIQTLLLNGARFRLSNDDLRFVDFTGSRDGRPRILTMADLPALANDAIYFARKFDPDVDPDVLDALDQRIGARAAEL